MTFTCTYVHTSNSHTLTYSINTANTFDSSLAVCIPQEGEVRFLICTDVAARGIDICGIPFVVNMTLPDEKQNYVHRIGRVGRADRMGLAISLVSKVKEKVCEGRDGEGDRGDLEVIGLLDIGLVPHMPKSRKEVQQHPAG